MAKLNKEEYLKRYLSSTDRDQKKKKRKQSNKKGIVKSGMKILDDDIDVNALIPANLKNTLEEDVGDNKPTVADFIDERPDDVKQLEQYRQDNRWKLLQENSTRNHEDKPTDRKGLTRKEKRHDSDSDQTPDRTQSKHDSDSDESPKRTQRRYDSDSDQSPARTQIRHDSDSDQSPKRTQRRHDSDSDQSPARTQKRHDSDSDQSTARIRKKRDYKYSLKQKDSTKRLHQKAEYDSDQSIPRKQRKVSDSDQSPPRNNKNQSDSDHSPIRRRGNSDSDQSQVSKQRRSVADSDQSPVRKHRKQSRFDSSPKTTSHKTKDRGKDHSARSRSTDKMKTTLAGAKAGLSSAKMLRDETEMMKRKEKELFDKIGDDKLGRYAKSVFRDKTGKRRDFEKEAEENSEKAKKKAVKDKKYEEWGKGLAQVSRQEKNVEEAVHEMSKPLARYRDDADLDEELKAVDRAGDPMAEFLTKKKQKNIDMKKELPKYKGPEPPPNRFNLRPGYRWDGVNRSNGFEKKLFESKTNRKALAQEAYMWSVEDM